ncbi:hypothetical protein H8D91_02270, partial [archaeon]|nr:hypothetical protein [archaeon]
MMNLSALQKPKLNFSALQKPVKVGVFDVAREIPGTLKTLGQDIVRNIGSMGVSIGKLLGGAEEITPPKSLQFLFRDEPIKSVEQRVAEAELKLKDYGQQRQGTVFGDIASKYPKSLAFAGIMGSVGIDLTPFGGLQKNALKALVKTKTPQQAISVLTKMGVADDLAKTFADDVVKVNTTKSAKALFNNIANLQKTTKPVLNTSALTGKSKPLAQEAKKYNSAEEFVKAQSIYYHGTNAKFDKFDLSKLGKFTGAIDAKLGFHFTKNKNIASSLGKNVKELYLDIKNPFDLWGDFVGNQKKYKELYRIMEAKKKGVDFKEFASILDDGLAFDNAGFKVELLDPNVIKNMKRAGYDGLKLPHTSEDILQAASDGAINLKGSEVIPFELNQIKTKSQLTDIYTQATKGVGKVKPEVKQKIEPTQEAKPIDNKLKVLDEITKRQNESIQNSGRTESQKQSALKGIGMAMSAIKRKLIGEPTKRELEVARDYLESNYHGKEVRLISNGLKGEVVGTSFGKIRVKMNVNGEIRSIAKENIQESIPSRKGVLEYLRTEAEKKLSGLLDIYKPKPEPVAKPKTIEIEIRERPNNTVVVVNKKTGKSISEEYSSGKEVRAFKLGFESARTRVSIEQPLKVKAEKGIFLVVDNKDVVLSRSMKVETADAYIEGHKKGVLSLKLDKILEVKMPKVLEPISDQAKKLSMNKFVDSVDISSKEFAAIIKNNKDNKIPEIKTGDEYGIGQLENFWRTANGKEIPLEAQVPVFGDEAEIARLKREAKRPKFGDIFKKLKEKKPKVPVTLRKQEGFYMPESGFAETNLFEQIKDKAIGVEETLMIERGKKIPKKYNEITDAFIKENPELSKGFDKEEVYRHFIKPSVDRIRIIEKQKS